MSYVLVTGGAGFIGANLCERLLKQGKKIICADDLSTGTVRNVETLKTIAQQAGNASVFIFSEIDVADADFAEKVCSILPEGETLGSIYHLACPASPVHYQKDPIKTSKTCFLGALNVLEIARKFNARVLFASTSEVYGDPLEHPQKESYRGNVNPDGPRACYDEGKRIAETLFFDASRMYGTDIRIARIFNTYGPMMDPSDGRVVSNFINQALSGNNITVFGDGSQTRSFMYIDDLLDGFQGLMEQETSPGPVNLGNPEEYTVLETAKIISDIVFNMQCARQSNGADCSENIECREESCIVFKPLPQDDPLRRKPDISLAKELFGFSPKTSFREGLAKTAEYFKKLQGTD